MQLKRVKIRRERASFPALVIAFLAFSLVFFLSTESVDRETAVPPGRDRGKIETRPIELESASYYLIALSGGESAEEARISGARYMQRGAAGYLFKKDGKIYSVGNMYTEKEAAEKMRLHLKNSGIEANVIEISAPGATLRVTAEEKTLDLTQFCLSALSEFEARLLDYSAKLDAGELTRREAGVLLSVLAYDYSAHEAAARAALPRAGKNAAGEIYTMYLDLLDEVTALTKDEGGELMLSARIKHAAIDGAVKRVDLLNSLDD